MKNLHKSFGEKKVLKGISFHVHQGHSLGIMGASGSGKSVTLKTLLRLMEPDEGAIYLGKENIVTAAPKQVHHMRSRVGVLFQGSALFDSLSIYENIFFADLKQGVIKDHEAQELSKKALEDVGLAPDIMFMKPSDLSGGMQRRVGLARAKAQKPTYLFLDEPTSGLDPVMAALINRLIRETITSLKATAVTITHDMNTLRTVSDAVAMIHQGKVIWQGPTKDLDTCDHACVRQFIQGSLVGPLTD